MKKATEDLEATLIKKESEISALKDKLDKYEAAANGANDGLWDWDLKKRQTFVSGPWMTMLGMQGNEHFNVDDIWNELIHPDDKVRAARSLKDYINGVRESYREEFRLRHKDGSYRWVLSKAQAVRDENGQTIRISGSHTDITHQKLADDALKKSEEKFRNLFQNSLVAMFRSHAETGQIIEANEILWRLLGKTNEERTNVKLGSFMDERTKRKILDTLQLEGSIESLEFQIKGRDYKARWVSFSAVLYREERIIECILKDITETKESLLELQKVNFELDSFVYHASHDLRSPLRSILGLIDLYRLEDNTSIKDECIEKIKGSVNRLDDLVVELLSISRNDRVNDPHVDINFMLEVNNSISSYYNATNTSGLEITTDIRQPVHFKSDLTRIRIILNNLISNAIKYRSFHKEETFVHVSVHVDEHKAELIVQDNGEGIEESKLPHIFDMFYRATEKSEGSGLGLYIVKKVSDKLKATIAVESEELEGTTFKIIIPNSLSDKDK